MADKRIIEADTDAGPGDGMPAEARKEAQDNGRQ